MQMTSYDVARNVCDANLDKYRTVAVVRVVVLPLTQDLVNVRDVASQVDIES
jgi:hypothetical protein